jgi:hypothetical protein
MPTHRKFREKNLLVTWGSQDYREVEVKDRPLNVIRGGFFGGKVFAVCRPHPQPLSHREKVAFMAYAEA